MRRVARIVIADVAHHITQRGNNQQDVFLVDEDRQVYLDLLQVQCQRYGFTVTGYCLMTNHVHLIGTPERSDALAKAIGRTHFLYTQYINRLHGSSGHLWQNRFYSCPMDEAHALQALCYVELNPVRAGMVKAVIAPSEQRATGLSPLSPCDYPWSRAAAHCGMGEAHSVLHLEHWHTVMPAAAWQEILRQFQNDEAAQALRLHTRTGRPLGSDSFLSKLEHMLGHRLRPLPVGRPRISRKQKTTDEKK